MTPTKKTFRIVIDRKGFAGSEIEITRYYDTDHVSIHSFASEHLRIHSMTLKEAAAWFRKVADKLDVELPE